MTTIHEETTHHPDLTDIAHLVSETNLIYSLGYLTHTWSKGFSANLIHAPRYPSKKLAGRIAQKLKSDDPQIFTRSLLQLGWLTQRKRIKQELPTWEELTVKESRQILNAYTILAMGDNNHSATLGCLALNQPRITLPLVTGRTLYLNHITDDPLTQGIETCIQATRTKLLPVGSVDYVGTIDLSQGTVTRYDISNHEEYVELQKIYKPRITELALAPNKYNVVTPKTAGN